MKKLLLILAMVLLCSSAWAATKVQVMTDGKIDVDKLPTITFKQDGDPTNATDGQLWYNSATNQIKVRDGGMVYHWNATGSAEYADAEPEVTYLVDEDFEGTGKPEEWTYSTGGGITVNYDDTSTVLSGSESLSFTGEGWAQLDAALPGVGSVSVDFYIRPSRDVKVEALVQIRDDTTDLASFVTDGNANIGVSNSDGSNFSSMSFSGNNTYRLRLSYTAGTGTNGTMSISTLDENGNPTVLVQRTNLTKTSGATAVRIKAISGGSIFYDDIRVQ